LHERVHTAGRCLNAPTSHRSRGVDAQQRHDVDRLLHGTDDLGVRIRTRLLLVALEAEATRRL
jgi:hypothetical protein